MLRRSVMDDGDPGFETTDTEAEVFDREHPLADIPDLDYEIDLYGAAELVMAGIERLDLCEKIMAFENGELEDLEIFELFQGLCDTGMIFDLQGSYQRLAIRLAADGLVHLHHRDDAGNCLDDDCPGDGSGWSGSEDAFGEVFSATTERGVKECDEAVVAVLAVVVRPAVYLPCHLRRVVAPHVIVREPAAPHAADLMTAAEFEDWAADPAEGLNDDDEDVSR